MLRGRVALVCAASRGLGKATAIGFVREAARDRTTFVLLVVVDLTKPGDIRRDVSPTRYGSREEPAHVIVFLGSGRASCVKGLF